MEGDCSNILTQWYIYFIEISSGYLIFFISLFSVIFPLELGSESDMIRDTPYFLGLELRKRRRRACSFDISVVSRALIFFSFLLVSALEASLELSYRYVSLILAVFILRD